MVDYDNEIGSFFLRADYTPDELVQLSFGGTYTQSKGSYEAIMLELPEETAPHADYDFSEVNTYSDLDYNQSEVYVRGDVKVTNDAAVYLGISYFDLNDGRPYVYGDMSGSVLFTQGGLKLNF